MATAEQLHAALSGAIGKAHIVDALPRYISRAPQWLNPESEQWNVAPLNRRVTKKVFTLDFTRVTHRELRTLAQAHALWQIVERQLGTSSLNISLIAFIHLSYKLGTRPLKTLKTEDFHAAEQHFRDHFAAGTSARMCAELQRISEWLNRQTGLRLDYVSKLRAPQTHGRAGTEEGRGNKLLPDSIIADLLAAWHNQSLSARDRFYLAIIAVSVATGFRLGELLALPVDCLIEDQGALLVRAFVSKKGKAAPRPVPPELAEIVIDAVQYIREVTKDAREQARAWVRDAPIDWTSVVRNPDPTVFDYFVRRWLDAWIKDPDHRMIDSRWAYFSHGDQSEWIPIADLLKRHKDNVSSIARELDIARRSVDRLIEQMEASKRGEVYLGKKTADSPRSFDTDLRFPSIIAFRNLTGLNLGNSPRNAHISELIQEARKATLSQSTFQCPDRNAALEDRYRVASEVLRDPETGKAVLYLHEALFVIFKNQLSDGHVMDMGRVHAVSISTFNHWLAGYSRDRGTGKSGDAVCARLGIVDPRTEEPARFTSHDFRHWLETAYENGGLSQTQIATLFNRSSTTSNSVYDHTNSTVRRERLKDAMSDGLLIGHSAEAYAQIASESPEEAAQYLEAATKFYNPMPHGICRLNWALEPCPHSLSCFSCGDANDEASEPCEHLVVDTQDAAQIDEIERINRNTRSIVQIMEDDGAEQSPQYARLKRITRSTKTILERAGRS